jgi:hypothetical protein
MDNLRAAKHCIAYVNVFHLSQTGLEVLRRHAANEVDISTEEYPGETVQGQCCGTGSPHDKATHLK